ncbi:unnamed protein product, partial [Owenia fusiformis]
FVMYTSSLYRADVSEYLMRTRFSDVVTTNSAVFLRNKTDVILPTNKTNKLTIKTEESLTKKSDVIMILLWSKCMGHACMPAGIYGDADFKCEVTEDRSKIKEAQAVMFHTCILSNVAEVGLPTYRSANQKWIFRCAEAPAKGAKSTRKIPLKFLELQDALKDAFNFTMTTRLDSDYHTYHGLYSVNPDPPKVLPDYAQGKSKPVAWIASHHCESQSRRELYVQRLREHIEVDAYGGCGWLTCPDPTNRAVCQRHVGATYKFYLAFENSDCRDYVTEKVWKNSFLMNTVPIVRGYYSNFKSILPPGSYIHTNEFPNPKALAKYLKYLDKNHTAYNEYLMNNEYKWRLTYKIDSTSSKRNWGNGLCRKLHETKGQTKTYKNIWKEFYSFDNNCYNYYDIPLNKFDK